MHVTCDYENTIIGFALFTEKSLCRDIAGVTVCNEYVDLPIRTALAKKEAPLTLSPTYDCDNNGGLCGRITKQPSNQMKNEILTRMGANGWTIESTSDLMWIEVNDLTYCELNKDACATSYSNIGYAAIGGLVLIIVSIFTSLVLDFYVDIEVVRLANDYKYRQIAKINTLYTS
jgi:hypothetical protein